MDLAHTLLIRLQPFLVEVLRLTVWLALLAAIFVPLERLFALHPRDLRRRGVAADLVFYFLNSLVTGFLLALPLAALAGVARSLQPASWQAFVGGLPLWARLIAALVIGEVGAYWSHRMAHEVPFLWRFHAVHHAPEHLDWLINTRAHPVDDVFIRVSTLAPIYALGLQGVGSSGPGLVPVLVTILGTIWTFFIHANVRWRLGLLERLIATPFFHHWHHTNDENINKNYAALLPVMDRVFGTLHMPGHWPSCYGIREPLAPTVHGQLMDPLLPKRRKGLAPSDGLQAVP